MSWGGGEFSGETSLRLRLSHAAGHQGVTFLASTGDDGTPAGYPAFSPNVVAVGGTSLDINSSGDYLGESAWSDGGRRHQPVSNRSPATRSARSTGPAPRMRTVPDVSMDADPNTGVYVLDSYDGGYFQVGGTSLATPMWAGLIAIANQGRALDGESSLNGQTQTLPTLYSLPSSDFHDITTGSNGTYSATVGLRPGDRPAARRSPICWSPRWRAIRRRPQPPSVSGPSAIGQREFDARLLDRPTATRSRLTDAQAGSNADSLTLTVTDGTLTLGSTSGLTSVSRQRLLVDHGQRHAGQSQRGPQWARLHADRGLQRLRFAARFAHRSGRQPDRVGHASRSR